MQDVKINREARRRKILENAEKRLQKITRLKYGDDETIPDHLLSVSPDALTSEVSIDDINLGSTQFTNVTSNNRNCAPDSSVKSTFNSQSSSFAKSVSNRNNGPKFWKKLGFKVVILAIIVRLVHIFRLGYLFGETIVIPFSVFMLTQLGSCQFDQNAIGITGPMLLFFGVSPNKITNLLICYNVVTSILTYFGIYIFTFVLVHLICVIIFGL